MNPIARVLYWLASLDPDKVLPELTADEDWQIWKEMK
jgi:hypothetical protein